jgi:hypothetical protein
VTYLSTDVLHPDLWPPVNNDLQGGAVITLAQTDLEDKLSTVLNLEAMKSDDQLAAFITARMNSIRALKPIQGKPIKPRSLDLFHSPLFMNMSQAT